MIEKWPPMPMSSSASASSLSSLSIQKDQQQQQQQKYRQQELASTQSALDTSISPIFDQLIYSRHFLLDGAVYCNEKRGKNQHRLDTEIQIMRLRKLRQLLDQLHDALMRLLLGMMTENCCDSIDNNNNNISSREELFLKERKYFHSQSDPQQNDIDSRDGESLLATEITGTKIVNQLDTIALPILDILQREHWFASEQRKRRHPTHETRAVEDDNNAMIRRSLSYSCMEKAALILAGLWKLRQRISLISIEMATTSTTDIAAHHSGSIRKLVVPSLVSCAMALSSLDIAREEQVVGDSSVKDDPAATASADIEVPSSMNDSSSIATTIASTEKRTTDIETKKTIQRQSLDRGEDCAVAILSCVQSFVQFDANERQASYDDDFDDELLSQCAKERGDENDSVSPQHILSHEVGSAMGGALIARLVQGCLSLLSPLAALAEGKHENTVLQLEALKTLHNLLISVPSQNLWRSILPGCFASLYRAVILRLQSLSSSLYSPFSTSFKRIASASVRVLALLLDKSLYSKPPVCKENQQQHHHLQQPITDKNVKINDTQSITSLLIAAVQQSPLKSQFCNDVNELSGDTISPEDAKLVPLHEEDDRKLQELKTEVNNRLVGPILVLLSLLSSNCCKDVTKSGLHLCKIVMINIRTIWTESNYEALEKKSLEFCLMMMMGDDEDYKLKRCSLNVIHSFKTHHPAGAWKRKLRQSIAPTILELMETLPAFARSGREMQVRHNLRLIQGYLLISFRDVLDEIEFITDSASLKEKMRKSDIGQALSCPEAVDVVKYTFSVLFAPDVDTMTCNTMTSIKATLASDLSRISPHHESSSRYCRFLYLSEEAVGSAKKTVHLFARVLGAKRCAFLIDDCFAEVFKSHSQSCGEHLLPTKGDIDRRRLWSGECIFISELLRGISGPFKPSTSMIHIFSSLASSVLPLIVSDPLWTLPTVLEAGAVTCDNIKMQSDEFETSGWQLNCNQLSNGQFSCQSVTVMNSNAVLISVMMGVIREFTLALGGGIRLHLPMLLFPILERASPIGNHTTVQGAAIATLQDITHSVGNNDISSLITLNFDYLVDVLSMRLRKYGRESMFIGRSCVGVVDLILRASVYNGERDSSNGNCPITFGHVSMASNLLTCFLSCLDRQSTMTNLNVLDAARVLQSTCQFIESSIDAHLNSSTPVDPMVDDYDWCQRLDFYLTAESTGHTFDGRFYDDFPTIEPEINHETELADESLLGDSHTLQKYGQEVTIFTQEIIVINTILSRSCYLLCYSNLQTQVTCCETILSGFRSLGKIGLWQKKFHGESASNPLFRAIAEYWPPIIARLRLVSANLDSVNRSSRSDLSVRNITATDQVQSYCSQAGLEVLISKLLLVNSELCLSSDGFFADRFENDAYPIIAILMTNILSTCCNSTDRQLLIPAPTQTLLLSILHCLKCTFESGCRRSLAGIIPAAGAMILPLLAFQGPAGEGAADTLKTMLMVDSDSLWRELQNLSGNQFPCNPIFSSSASSVTRFLVCPTTTSTLSTNNRSRQSCDFLLSQKALELLEFIERLPEQEL